MEIWNIKYKHLSEKEVSVFILYIHSFPGPWRIPKPDVPYTAHKLKYVYFSVKMYAMYND